MIKLKAWLRGKEDNVNYLMEVLFPLKEADPLKLRWTNIIQNPVSQE
jgi:hypothetical protein